MKKIKTILKKCWVLIKKHYYLSISFVIFLIVIFLFSPIFHANWLAYPQSLKARIALKMFLKTFDKNSYCREKCATARLFYSNIISRALDSKDNNYVDLVEKEILKPETPVEASLNLLKLCKDGQIAVTDNIKNFYTDNNNDFKLRAELANTWPEISSASFISEIIGRYKRSDSVLEKISLLDLLNDSSDNLVSSLFWEIILGNEGADLKAKALYLLSNAPRKDLIYQVSDLDSLQLVLEDQGCPERLKDSVIWLINEYYSYFPNESQDLLLKVANGENFDNYQKTFAINILNKQNSTNFKMPELSQADWDSYYNN